MRLCCRMGLLSTELFVFFFKQKTAYEMRISDWSSDVCSSDLAAEVQLVLQAPGHHEVHPWRVALGIADQLDQRGLPGHQPPAQLGEGETALQGDPAPAAGHRRVQLQAHRDGAEQATGGDLLVDRAGELGPRDRKRTRMNSKHSC